MSNKFLSREYWLQLRKRTRVNGSIGSGLCDSWCGDARKILEEDGNSNGFRQKGTNKKNPILAQRKLGFHTWLESNLNGYRYIADGTAGQFDPDYPRGFYGFLEEASDELRIVYSE